MQRENTSAPAMMNGYVGGRRCPAGVLKPAISQGDIAADHQRPSTVRSSATGHKRSDQK